MASFGSFARQAFLLAAWAVFAILTPGLSSAFFSPPLFGQVSELVNEETGRYILVTTTNGLGPGWHSTGYGFSYQTWHGFTIFGPVLPDTIDVCHFYAAQTDSHFFTANPVECAGLKAAPDSGWHYEGVAFSTATPVGGEFNMSPPSAGTCRNDSRNPDAVRYVPKPIYRLHSEGGRRYRYVFDDELRARMLREGWSDDGLAFCQYDVFHSDKIDVIELVNDAAGQYLWLTGAELVAVEQGSAGPGWRRTGYRFGYFGGAYPVCRFYASLTNAHFFTASSAECNGLRNAPSSGWRYEGEAFRSTACSVLTTALYRLYRDGGRSYRYVFDGDLRARMIHDGWTDDGLAFCEEFVYRDQ